MPEERGYTPQVAPGSVQRAVLSDPRDFGAAVGSAIEQAGSTVHQLKLRSYRLDRQENADSEAADFAKRFTQLRADMDEASREARNSSGPGAKGHAKGMAELLEKQREQLFSGLTEDSVRRDAEVRFADYAQRFGKGEGDYEEGRRVDKLVTDVGDAIDIARNRVRTAQGNTETYAEELSQQIASIYAMPGVSDDIKDKLAKQAEQGLSVSHLQAVMDSDPARAKASIDAGEFNDLLDPQQLEALRNGADVEIRRVEAQKERELAQAKAALNERIATVKAMDEQGIEVPDETLGELEAAAMLAGDQSTAVQLQGIRANNQFAKVWEKATPVQREQRLAALEAKAKPTLQEQREIDWLKSKSGALDSQFNSDPFGAISASGMKPPPPVDLADPRSVRDRAAWRRAASQASGRPVPFFSKNEVAGYRERYEQGWSARLGILREFDAFGNDAEAKAAAARDIDPDDRHFQIMAQLNPVARSMLADGLKALERKGFFAPSKDNPDKPNIDKFVTKLNGDLAFALRRTQAGSELQDVAEMIASGILARQGQDGDNLTEKTYRRSIDAALGSRNGTGGLSYWNGNPFIIADGFTLQGFEAAVVRDIRRKKDNPPVNPDGSAAQLSKAIPTLVGPGRYQWFTRSGQVVLGKDGQPYVSEVVAGK